MNKYLILLGLVLLATLSFAQPANWMQAAEGRYSCMYDYSLGLLNLIGPNCAIIEKSEYSDLYDNEFHGEGGMYDSTYTMMSSAGCSHAPTNPTLFRSAMMSFNTNNAAFRQALASAVRECVADPKCECSGTIGQSLSSYRAEYLSCLIGEEELPYCREPEEGGD